MAPLVEESHDQHPNVRTISAEPDPFAVGQQVFVAMIVNIRRTPGWRSKPQGDILGHLTVRTPATIQGGPTQKDSLTWWTVSSKLSDGTAVEGWVADALTDGRILLSAAVPQQPPSTRTDTFRPGEAVTIVSKDAVNVRSSPGYKNKPPEDIIGKAEPGTALAIVPGFREADGLFWWRIHSTDIDGWVAEAAPNGIRLLAPESVSKEIHVGSPFQEPMPMTQGWGSHPVFYSKFKYDGVPLKGHNGLDFAVPMRTLLIAVDAGNVKRTGFEPDGFGHFVLLQHDWGESLYAHLEEVHVQRDQAVDSAQAVGLSGNTGASTGPHLHFSIRITPYHRRDGWGGFANPIPFMALAKSVWPDPVEDRDPTPMGEETLENPRP